jgi:hypothetical protein
VEMPEALRNQYQYFTEAQMGKLGDFHPWRIPYGITFKIICAPLTRIWEMKRTGASKLLFYRRFLCISTSPPEPRRPLRAR